MPKANHGWSRAIGEMFSGLMLNIVIGALIESGLLPPAFALLFSLIGLVANIELIMRMKYWGIAYLIGWILALIIIGPYIESAGYLLVQLVVGVVYLGIKIRNRLNRSSYSHY